jgi:hypothetical protein
MQRIKIIGNLLGEVAALFPGKTDIAAEIIEILVDKQRGG